jgi:hypothetical protein
MATKTKPTLSERRRAFVAEALMIRALFAYCAARNKAEENGVDLSADPVAPGFKAMSERYDNLLSEWATEMPNNYLDMMAYLDLVATIIDGERVFQREIDSDVILSTERDFGHALTLLTSVRRWLNEKDMGEYVAAENARIEAAARGGRL